MNERLSAAGGQVKQAFFKIRESWRELAPTRKRIIVIASAALLALVLILVISLNVSAGKFVTVYEGLSEEESVKAVGVLQQEGLEARVNDKGMLEVPSKNLNLAMGKLAIAGIPAATLDYSILEKAGGLTTTDAEKRAYQTNQLQNRLQDIIKTYDDVENAYVTLNLNQNSTRVWDVERTENSAAVKVNVRPGGELTAGQVSGIRYLVGSSVGIDPENVSVMDSDGNALAKAGEANDVSNASTQDFLQRQGFEGETENRLKDKVANILSLPYPETDDYRVSVTVKLDWDKMMTESMQYSPLEGTEHGVASLEGYKAQMGIGQYAEGVVGETNNTDVPTYADLDGDGTPDAVDYAMNREFLVSYIKNQIEKDGAKIDEASIGVMVRGTLNGETRQTLRELIAAATNIPLQNVSVQGMLDSTTQEETDAKDTNRIGPFPAIAVYIAAAVLLLAIIALIIVLVIRKKTREKHEAEEAEEVLAEAEETNRAHQEIEERKQQLRDAAMGDLSGNAIADEVREFAKANPEITANLLRNWLKEGET